MADPVTLTVGTIAALAFTKFLESSAETAGQTITAAILSKMETLRQKIYAKLRGVPVADDLNAAAEKGETVSEEQVTQLTPHLEAAMRDDNTFAQEVRQLASEINQEINIDQILGKNVQNVYGGSAVQQNINDPSAPVFAGDIYGGVHFNYGEKKT